MGERGVRGVRERERERERSKGASGGKERCEGGKRGGTNMAQEGEEEA